MLSDYEGNDGAQMMSKPGYSEPCKPDYESMIKRCAEKRAKNVSLTEAVLNYVGNTRLRGPLAEMVGELVSEERQLSAEIDALIKAQEGV